MRILKSKKGIHAAAGLLSAAAVFALPVTAAAATIDAGSFENTYAADSVSAHIEATKELDGRDLVSGEFTFELTDEDGDVVAEAVNDADGDIVFDDLEYEEEGEYTYTISEVTGDAGGVTYDESTFEVTVSVVSDGEGVLEVTVEYDEDPVFENTYEAEDVTARIIAQKVLTGQELSSGQFSFTLTNEKGSQLDTVTNDADGDITFEEITFSQTGTFRFFIAETVGSDANMSYDTHTYEVDVVVTDDGEGTLEAEVSGVPTFTNAYITALSYDGKDGADTTVSDQQTGDETALGIYVGLVIAGLAGVLWILLKKWKQG